MIAQNATSDGIVVYYDPKRNLGGRELTGLRLVALGGTGAARAEIQGRNARLWLALIPYAKEGFWTRNVGQI